MQHEMLLVSWLQEKHAAPQKQQVCVLISSKYWDYLSRFQKEKDDLKKIK